MLRADDVSFVYGRASGRRAAPGTAPAEPGDGAGVHHISLEVPAGGLVGILGPNGCGKTTLLRLLGGTLKPATGRVAVEGRDIATLSRRELARLVSVVPQETRLAFEYSVLEVVLMGRYPHLGTFQLEGREDLAIAREALAATGTLPLEHRMFATLSGGEKQRVVIAGALAQAAPLMLLDEPTAALDPGYQIEIGALLRHLNADRGVTMVVATHDLNFAAGVCRQLVLVRAGRVLAAGATSDVLTRINVRALYDVEADVQYHERAGHLTVVPIARTQNPELGTRNSEPGSET